MNAKTIYVLILKIEYKIKIKDVFVKMDIMKIIKMLAKFVNILVKVVFQLIYVKFANIKFKKTKIKLHFAHVKKIITIQKKNV